jgi:MFS transporter, SP family, xylose:H+ symportor
MQIKYNWLFLIRISLVTAMGGYLFGFDFAVITGGLPFLSEQFGLGASGEGGTTASLALGAVFGCIIAGNIADKYGRKPGLLLAAGTFTVSSIIMGIAPNLTVFIVGRFFAGIGVGMASMLSPLYIAEIAPQKYRGRLVSLNQLTIVMGIVITHLVNYSLKDTGPEAWRWMFGSGSVPSALFLLGVVFLPESPRWQIKMNRNEPAYATLRKIGGDTFATDTSTLISNSLQGEQKVPFKVLFDKTYLPVLTLGIVLAVFQQWCGINVVFNYTAKIFESIGANRSEQLVQAIYIGIANLVFTIVAMTLVDKLGRKPLMLFGAGGLAVLYLAIAFFIKTNNGNMLSPFVLVAIGTYAISLAPVTWVLISEIFPNNIRGKAISVATVALWLAYSLLVFTFPIIAEKLGEFFPFIGYSVICILGFFFIKFKLTETKGKSLETIENDSIKLH